MDITDFITWLLNEIIKLFTNIFNILNNITFSGTSLLKVIITIGILGALIPIILTIAPSGMYNKGESAGRDIKREREKEKRSKTK